MFNLANIHSNRWVARCEAGRGCITTDQADERVCLQCFVIPKLTHIRADHLETTAAARSGLSQEKIQKRQQVRTFPLLHSQIFRLWCTIH